MVKDSTDGKGLHGWSRAQRADKGSTGGQSSVSQLERQKLIHRSSNSNNINPKFLLITPPPPLAIWAYCRRPPRASLLPGRDAHLGCESYYPFVFGPICGANPITPLYFDQSAEQVRASCPDADDHELRCELYCPDVNANLPGRCELYFLGGGRWGLLTRTRG